MSYSPTGYEAVYGHENEAPYAVLPVISVDPDGNALVLNEEGIQVRAFDIRNFSHVRSIA
ncbi:hypothetical protein ABT348_24165 [Streptomyces olivaceus]|uniref:hypothetical protein n=1 Tax=Streptomyces olivaceus TaxID=47716 RepID=UPI003326CEEC